MATAKASKGWAAQPMAAPKLTQSEWGMAMVVGLVFIVMAVLQIVGFSGFKDALGNIGLSSPSTWAVLLILVELWAAAGFFKLPLSRAFRATSSFLAILVSGFWFFEAVRLAAAGTHVVTNNAFFGKYLVQSPGWWTVVEASVVLFWTFWAVRLTGVLHPSNLKEEVL